ncbi:hypothetical protein PENSPDRAFT_744889 [Peniophora sp. CONT]|nr:hypothetical protein PENSPDRAFT_744889 [Peniophora sp. CONT]
MRAVVQRVLSASVAVDNETISQISRGLMVLVGIGIDDTTADMDILVKKILTLRVFDDANGNMWKSSVKDIAGEVLCVSQFTLFANTSKGNKPDFHKAMGSAQSRDMYATFLQKMKDQYSQDKIQDGKFGAMMNVSLTNEGPVTFTLDSRKYEYVDLATPVRSGTSNPKAAAPQKRPSGTVGPTNAESGPDTSASATEQTPTTLS